MLVKGLEASKLVESLDYFPKYSIKFVPILERPEEVYWALVSVWDESSEISSKAWNFKDKDTHVFLSIVLEYYASIILWSQENLQK